MEEEESTTENKTPDAVVAKLKYKKLGSAGIDGVIFQVNLLTIFLLNAIERKDDWRLSTENVEGEKFDDVIFEASGEAVLLQAKHRKNVNKKITVDDLFSTNSKNDDFSLPKYYFSYQNIKKKFKVRNVIICTNAVLDIGKNMSSKTKLDPESMLYTDIMENICHTFTNSIASELQNLTGQYFKKNLQTKGINPNNISYDSIEDYINHLQFVAGYPSDVKFDTVINKKIAESKYNRNLPPKTAQKFIHQKMIDWYRQKNGSYLNHIRSIAIFSELYSNRFREVLEQHKVYFECNNFTESSNKIQHIVANEANSLIYLLSVYEKLKDKQLLFVNIDEDIDIQNMIIDSFSLPQYSHLFIIGSKVHVLHKQIGNQIRILLRDSVQKKIILVGEEDTKIARILESMRNDYEKIHFNASFKDLTDNTRKRFLSEEIIFQGNFISLNDLLLQASMEDLNRILNVDVISKLLKNEKIKIGNPLMRLDGHIEHFYIHRGFCQDDEYISEENIYLAKDKVILISDTPGMGKTTVLVKIANTIKRNYPGKWVFCINLNSCTKYFRSIESCNINDVNVAHFFRSQDSLAIKNEFEENIFYLHEKVIVLLDGVDEISFNYTNLILNLISQCKAGSNFGKVFLTTRPHIIERLETALGVRAFTLKPLSQRDQRNFLRKYWKRGLSLQGRTARKKCKIYARQLVTNMSTWFSNTSDNNLAAIPLHTGMLAELFQGGYSSYNIKQSENWECCDQYIRLKHNREPCLPKKIDLAELYRMFIHKKFNIFLHDKGNPTGNVVAQELITQSFKMYYTEHYDFALKEILDKREPELFKRYDSVNHFNKDSNFLRIGLVQKLGTHIQFVHRTFAEYFVAECVLNELKSKPSKQFQTLLLDKLLYFKQFSVIRAFLDNLLQEELKSIPKSTFETFHYIDYNSLRSPRIPADKGLNFFIFFPFTPVANDIFLQTIIREGCVNILRFFFQCFDFTPSSVISKFFYNPKINIDMKDFNNETLLHIAITEGHIDVVKLLVNRGANLEIVVKGGTSLSNAVAWNRKEVVKVLLNNGVNVNIKDVHGGSPLLNSTYKNNVEMVRLILEEGKNVDVDIRDADGLTPLLLAAYSNNLNLVKLLVRFGANVNLQDEVVRPSRLRLRNWSFETNECHFTALHVATQRSNLAMVTFLAENCADINCQSGRGRTPLHIAVRNKNKEISRFLANRSEDVNIGDKFGRTALHEAALQGNKDMYDFFVSLGWSEDIKDQFERTPSDMLKEFQNR